MICKIIIAVRALCELRSTVWAEINHFEEENDVEVGLERYSNRLPNSETKFYLVSEVISQTQLDEN